MVSCFFSVPNNNSQTNKKETTSNQMTTANADANYDTITAIPYTFNFNATKPYTFNFNTTGLEFGKLYSFISNSIYLVMKIYASEWLTKGAVNSIRNQGNCGACWAFAAVTAWESAWFIKTGNLLQFSEQQMVDCSASNIGRSGGIKSN